MTTSHLPTVALRGRSGGLWAEDGHLTLEQDGVRRRIPLAAVREVRATDGPRGVEVVLTAPAGAPPTVYRLAHRRAAEVAVFVSAVNAGVPAPRDPVDGAALVVVEPGGAPRTPFWASPEFWLWTVIGLVGAGWVAGLTTLITHSDVIGAILWVFGTKPLLAGLVIYSLAAGELYDRAILWRRGVPVVATFSHTAGKKNLYRFTDLDGVQRHCEPDSSAHTAVYHLELRQVQVCYDPHKPDRVKARLTVGTWVLRSLGVGIFGTALLCTGLWMVPYQLYQVLS
ncbi:hypothetical protein ACFWWC_02690 [Streptomyces sp. NPDC058642]|uniref:hypothetical protein n=1 Tax=Streptomyces sp. NPDC058642 TaxID=3346572 RepID=UPI00365359A4